MRQYCTLFDVKYLPRGLILLKTLTEKSSQDFLLHILALDDETAILLRRLQKMGPEFAKMKIHHIGEMMTPALAEARDNRAYNEWCWTLASVFTSHLLKSYDEMVYLDSDMAFFGDPEIAQQEAGMRAISIVPHRLIPEKKYLECNGLYNVSWVMFRGELGKMACEHWANQCIIWCYNQVEPERFGDQKYLDKWPDLYGCRLAIHQNVGVGLAPWNITQYHMEEVNGEILVEGTRVVFYHYHEFQENEDQTFRLTNYHLRPKDIQLIYEPYLKMYKQMKVYIERAKNA